MLTTKKILAMLIRSRSFAAALKGSSIQLLKMIRGKPVSIILTPVEDGKNLSFWINPPSYNFRSPVSHFDYIEDENRLTRNKNVIMALVKDLQETEVWPFIANKQFFTPNANNKNLKKDRHLKKKVFAQFDVMMKS